MVNKILFAGPEHMDKRALAILNDTYWSASGWRKNSERRLPQADFAYAKAAGVMFDPIRLDHDGLVEKCLTVRSRVELAHVANAFVTSLSTRQLAYRSALGSYALLRHFPAHAWTGHDRTCAVCGGYKQSEKNGEDINVLNFERHKWGGVRHLQPLYAAFDLEQFLLLPPAEVEPAHIFLFKELLRNIERVPVGTSSTKLQSYLSKALKSNKAERDILIGVLGIAGLLETEKHRGFLHSFVPEHKRDLPGRRFVDMAYPACWWSQSDGINRRAIEVWFGHLL